METEAQSRNEISHANFKSYYVVWKLNEIGKQNPQLKEFKSYYVVWKPENENDENDIGRV